VFRSLAYRLRGAGAVVTRTRYSHVMAVAAAIDAVLMLVVIGLIAFIRRDHRRNGSTTRCTRH
jgi:hypothetical protein